MKFVLLALLVPLFSLSMNAQDSEAAFDFWIGEWEVSWYGVDSIIVKGTNTIEKILDGKVIQEKFEDPSRNFKGKSLSVFNPTTQIWHQAWADNQGGFYNFVGEINGNQRIFTTLTENAQGRIERMIFLNIKQDSLLWKWQGKKSDEEVWQDQWVIFYQRKK